MSFLQIPKTVKKKPYVTELEVKAYVENNEQSWAEVQRYCCSEHISPRAAVELEPSGLLCKLSFSISPRLSFEKVPENSLFFRDEKRCLFSAEGSVN